jgi:hypothetical protein
VCSCVALVSSGVQPLQGIWDCWLMTLFTNHRSKNSGRRCTNSHKFAAATWKKIMRVHAELLNENQWFSMNANWLQIVMPSSLVLCEWQHVDGIEQWMRNMRHSASQGFTLKTECQRTDMRRKTSLRRIKPSSLDKCHVNNGENSEDMNAKHSRTCCLMWQSFANLVCLMIIVCNDRMWFCCWC